MQKIAIATEAGTIVPSQQITYAISWREMAYVRQQSYIIIVTACIDIPKQA